MQWAGGPQVRQDKGEAWDDKTLGDPMTPQDTRPPSKLQQIKKKTNLKIKAQGFESRLSLLAKWFSGTGEGNEIESSANASPLGPTRPSLNLCNQRRSCIQTPIQKPSQLFQEPITPSTQSIFPPNMPKKKLYTDSSNQLRHTEESEPMLAILARRLYPTYALVRDPACDEP